MEAAGEILKEHLQQLGRKAASLYGDGRATMTDAVVTVLDKQAGLTPEHVKRVVEFANNEAYRDEFDLMDGDHRIVSFKGGPASPGQVLRELEMADSAPAVVKSAAHRATTLKRFIPGEEELDGIFDVQKTAQELPISRPNGNLVDLRDRLGTVKSNVISKLSSAEVAYEQAAGKMYDLVKEAVLSGTSPAEISIIFQRTSPSPMFTKLALRHIASRMEPEGIPAVVASREKVKQASQHTLNPGHPLVKAFTDFAKIAEKRATLINNADELDTQLRRVNKALFSSMKGTGNE